MKPTPRDCQEPECNLEAGGLGIGAQAWGLSKKLREVDEAMTPERQRLVHEVHPEVSFWALNGSKPMTYGKKSAEGARERVEALIRGGFPREFVQHLPPGLKVGLDDFLCLCRGVDGDADRYGHSR